MTKTNAIRILESSGIAFQTAEYEYEEGPQGALRAAERLGVPAERVFKTLVCRDERKNLYVFCIPADASLNLKKAARAAGAGGLELLPLKDLFPATGYAHGGCSPIGLKKPCPVFIDELATLLEWLYINGGRRGLQVRIAPADLAGATGARFADLG
jgi:Cys-tRNA(Pro)/Cys-tRNA(Cys) deacylase